MVFWAGVRAIPNSCVSPLAPYGGERLSVISQKNTWNGLSCDDPTFFFGKKWVLLGRGQLTKHDAALQSASDIGPVVTATLVASLSLIGTTNHRALASLAGLAPHACESDKRRGSRHIWGGRAQIRRALSRRLHRQQSRSRPQRVPPQALKPTTWFQSHH